MVPDGAYELGERWPRDRLPLRGRRLRGDEDRVDPRERELLRQPIRLPGLVDIYPVAMHEHDRRGGLRIVVAGRPDMNRAVCGLEAPVMAGLHAIFEHHLARPRLGPAHAGRVARIDRDGRDGEIGGQVNVGTRRGCEQRDRDGYRTQAGRDRDPTLRVSPDHPGVCQKNSRGTGLMSHQHPDRRMSSPLSRGSSAVLADPRKVEPGRNPMKSPTRLLRLRTCAPVSDVHR